jgi:uncharacterized protein (TIGR00730 family)
MHPPSARLLRPLVLFVAMLCLGPAAVAGALSVCVYCGSSDLPAPKYAELARGLGEGIGARRWTLVFGGNQTGLMGSVSRGAKAKGGRVVGVFAKEISHWEKPGAGIDERVEADTIRERKRVLQERADAFVVLPGGFGTLDELFDTLSLGLMDLHRKPVIVVNQDGYYDKLLEFIEHAIAEKFARESARKRILVVRSAEEALALLEKL